MVYLHFPQKLSEEEQMLQTKYEKLKRKKKAVQNLKTPSRGDGDGRHHNHVRGGHHGHHHHHQGGAGQSHNHHQGGQHVGAGLSAKRAAHVEARDAREVARKLIKSGAIAAIQKTPRREDQSGGFKRPCGLERKLERSDRPLSGYQPFSATQPDDFNNTGPIGGHILDHDRPRIKPFESMASSRESVSSRESGSQSGGGLSSGRLGNNNSNTNGSGDKINSKEPPKEGNTVYVTGNPISEQFLRTTFHECGPIVNVTMEIEKNCGFVTFQTKEAAAKAISVYHSCVVSDTQLKVTYARRQPPVDTMNAAHSAAAWSSAAANNSQKGSHKESRRKVDYTNNYFDWSEESLEPAAAPAPSITPTTTGTANNRHTTKPSPHHT